MNTIASAKEASRAHWLIVGAFSPRPTGRRFVITRDGFDDAIKEARLELNVVVADRLGTEAARTYALSFANLRSFTLKSMVQDIEPLGRLNALNEQIAKPSTRPAPDDLLTAIDRIVGKGVLYARAVKEAPAAPKQAPVGDAGKNQDAVDAIFEKAEVDTEADPKTAIDRFVRATQSPNRSSGMDAKYFQSVSRAIEDALYITAADIARCPAVAELESAWRGLKFLADQVPPGQEVLIEVSDVAPEALISVLRERLEDEPFDRPDAIIALPPIDTLDKLSSIADIAEQLTVPCIVAAEPALFGMTGLEKGCDTLADTESHGWHELRQNQVFRWLCAAANPIVLFTEGAGEAKRTVFGSPAVAIGAFLTASYRDLGTFARVIGPQGKVRAPATWTIPQGPFAGTAAPTRFFYSISTQNELAGEGIAGLGSARHSDQLILSAIPTAYGGSDASPLPAQLLTGRVVRFAQFVVNELAYDCKDEEVTETFATASRVFLFPAMDRLARLAARLVHEQDERWVEIEAKASAQVAMVPFEIAFRLPLVREGT